MRRGIRIYGKAGCERCTAAKEKLDLLGLKYEYHDLSEIIDEKTNHWRTRVDEALDLRAEMCIDESVPIVWMKGKGYMRYAAAMKAAKEAAKEDACSPNTNA